MRRPLRMGSLFALIVYATLLAGPASANPSNSRGRPTGNAFGQTNTSQVNAGRGMNRQGEPGVHPGKSWKDPGQVQGSPGNHADPDCTGNRTVTPQPTNRGACDDSQGAADKPGGSGGFDSDKDFNNGCGNDTDFGDDNNGRCGRHGPPLVGGPGPLAQSRETIKSSSAGALPLEVLGHKLTAPATLPAGAPLPVTGIDFSDLMLAGIGLLSIGRGMSRRQAKRPKRRG